ncbi:MAG: ABC transporter permease [Lachnospiraceae bacterium]|nr:ABC transporter permease [Lachnospiraceae bacterium]
MNNKIGKVIWFTFKQVITSNWYALIFIMGIVGVLLSTQSDKIMGALFGSSASAAGQAATVMTAKDATFMLQFVIILILFLMILVYGANIANSIVEEKSGRIIETLLCYVKPLDLLAGKIVGYLLAIIMEIAIWVGYYLILDVLLELPANPIFAALGALQPQVYVFLAASIIFGFMMYAFAFAALSSYADNAQDSTQLMFPVTIVIMIAYFLSLAIMNGMDGTWAQIIAKAPFFSPIVTFVTSDLIALTWKEVGINLAIQLVEVIVVAAICAKFYRRGVVSYGLKKMSFKKLLGK